MKTLYIIVFFYPIEESQACVWNEEFYTGLLKKRCDFRATTWTTTPRMCGTRMEKANIAALEFSEPLIGF